MPEENRIGLFIGRFQPFHLGHLSAIKQAFDKVNFLHIGIGSSQYSQTAENPFTAEERKTMVEAALAENHIQTDQFKITLIPDIHDFPAWPAHVRKLVGDFDVLFTRSNIVRELFEKYDDVTIIKPEKEIDISATEIRKKMQKEESWQENVPKGIVEIIDKIK